MGVERGAKNSPYKINLLQKFTRSLRHEPEGKRPLGRSRRGWVGNIKMNLREIEWDGTDWIDLAQDRD
jgi:hypothetical protein